MQIDKQTVHKILRNVFLGVLGCILLYWLLHDTDRVRKLYHFILGILSPFIVGSVLAFIVNVPMRAIEGMLKGVKSDRLRRVLAVMITLILVALVIAGVCWLLIPQLIDTVQSLGPKLQSFFVKLEKNLQNALKDNPQLQAWLTENLNLGKLNWADLAQKAASVIGNSVSTILTGAFSAIGTVASGVMNAFIAVVFAVYGLFQKETLARQGRKLLYAFLPEKVSDEIVRILRLSNSTFSNFLSGQCLEVVILGSMFAVSMAIFRMPYIPLVSVLVAVTAFIPVVGAWVGCIFGAFLILVANPIQAVWFVLMFLILQQIENHLIYPRVVGTSIGLSGMWVLVAVSVGGSVMGVAGMFLMIPLVSVAYTLLSEITNKRLATRNIDADKLQAHPPELKSKFKEKRERKKAHKEKTVAKETTTEKK